MEFTKDCMTWGWLHGDGYMYDMGMVTCEICNEDIGSIAHSLILDYQFCACVIRISGVPQLQVISMERLYGYK